MPVVTPTPDLRDVFRQFLKRNQLKLTPERMAILDMVSTKTGIFEAEQLLLEMKRRDDRVSKATIYRTLKHLLDAGILSEVLIDARQAHYRLSFGQPPQGVLVCVETGAVVEIPSPWLTALRDKICREHEYQPVSTRLVIYGVSPSSGRRKPQRA